MAFIIAEKHSYWWPVVARVPAGGGPFDEQKFQLRFETIDPVEAAVLEKEINQAEIRRDYSKSNKLLERIVTGWKEVQGAGNSEMPFSPDALAAACKLPWFRPAAFSGVSESQNGIERARGN